MSVRVRFAPSPTGLLHVGALRTALYDHLFAKHHGGVNILRIEDTDRTRYNPESEEEFVSTLEWVGITFDEGPHVGGPHAPYRQSERQAAGIYLPWVEELLAKGHAYRAYDTPEELDEMRTFQQVNKMATGYFGGEWRDASPDKVAEAEGQGKPSVVRLKVPRGQTIVAQDAIRGRLEWDSDVVDDPVLIKADGMPTYHFAAIVDDHLMGITHVFRGEEWIPSLPKHTALIQAFGWTPPVWVHCSVITGADGKKLSKRHGATRVLDYAAMGILPEPLKNFVALIGWAPGEDREVMTPAELIENFSVDGLQASPGRFDMAKLTWMNGVAIRSMSPPELLDAVVSLSDSAHAKAYWAEADEELGKLNPEKTWNALTLLADRARTDREYALAAVVLEQERVTTLADFGPACEFFMVDEVEFDPKSVEKWFGQEHVGPMFSSFLAALSNKTGAVGPEWCENLLRGYAVENGIEKLGPVVHPVRVALTGKTTGPGLFELMSVLGVGRMTARLERAKGMLR